MESVVAEILIGYFMASTFDEPAATTTTTTVGNKNCDPAGAIALHV